MVKKHSSDVNKFLDYSLILELINENVMINKQLTKKCKEVEGEIEREIEMVERISDPSLRPSLSKLLKMRETLKDSMDIVSKNNDIILDDVTKRLNRLIESSNDLNFVIEI